MRKHVLITDIQNAVLPLKKTYIIHNFLLGIVTIIQFFFCLHDKNKLKELFLEFSLHNVII